MNIFKKKKGKVDNVNSLYQIVEKYRGFKIEERFNVYYILGLDFECYSISQAHDIIDNWLDQYNEDN